LLHGRSLASEGSSCLWYIATPPATLYRDCMWRFLMIIYM